jgi:hypothetical protein
LADYFSRLFGFVFRGVIGDRKCGLGATHAGGDELPRKIVERGSRVLERVPGNQGNAGRNVIRFGDVVDQSSGLRIMLGADFIGISFLEGQQFALKIVDVLVGRVRFSP